MALDTIPKQEGGKLKAVASGALPNGKPVVVNSDGTVSVVEGSSATQAIGTATVFESATAGYTGVAFDSSNNKIVIAYTDSGNSGYGTAVVGTVTGTSISFGTPVVYESADSSWNAVTFDSNSNKVVITYSDKGNASAGTAVVGTVSGTSISFGSPVIFDSAGGGRNKLVYDTNAQKVVNAYLASGPGKVVVGTVSGTSISFGSPTTYATGLTSNPALTYDTTNQKVVLAWQDESASNQGRAAVGTVSGTSISFGTTATFSTDDSRALNLVYDAASGKVVICFRNASSTDDGVAVVGTVSGTSISFGSVVTFDSSQVANLTASYDANAQKVIVAYRDSSTNKGNFAVGTVDGTAITFATPVEFLGNSLNWTSSTFDANAEKVIVAYRDQGNSSYGSATAIQVAYENTNLTTENYIGISTGGAVADTGNATVDIVGTVNKDQSGLTAGQAYYVQTDGTLGTTADDPSVFAGTAVSATKMVVKS